jgi:hypothetical protein
MRQRSADLTSTDQCNLVSRHRRKVLDWLNITSSMICSENRFPLFGIMLRRPDPSRSLTRPAGAFKPPTAAKGPVPQETV